MKKTMIFLLLLLVSLSFVSCDPIEDREEMTGSITPEQIQATVRLEQIGGKNVNKVMFECSSPINCTWTNGILSKAGANGEMLMFTKGQNTVTLTGLCGDGTIITKEFTVNVEDMHYEIDPTYALFCGEGEKVWVWDDEAPLGYSGTAAAVWGNGGYKGGDKAPAWWKVEIGAQLDEQAVGKGTPDDGTDGSMTFTLSGMKLTKSSGVSGTFNFDMSKTSTAGDGTPYAIGELTTKGVNVLLGIQPNAGDAMVYRYDILKLTEDKMYLCVEDAANPGQAFFWCFKAK